MAALVLVPFAALLSFAAATQVGPDAAGRRPLGVVILNFTDPTLPAFVLLDGALRAALNAPDKPRVDVFAESLDALRFPGTLLEGEILTLLAKKYAPIRIDAVVAIGTAGLDFAEKHRGRLWPHARIVFLAVPSALLRGRSLSPTTTGIPYQHDVARTLELALGLRPKTRRLVVVAGSGDFDRQLAAFAKLELEPYAQRIAIEHWPELTLAELSRRIAGLRSDDAVLYLSLARDASGRTFVPRNVLKDLAAASPAPIYGFYETLIGHGAVAGIVRSLEHIGRRGGDLVHEVLALPADAPFPLAAAEEATCMADGSRLAQLGLSERALPEGCEVRFAPPSLWREYRGYVVGALLIIALQAALILALLLQRRARRKAEEETLRRRAELAQASRLALAGELTASIAHEINQPLGAILVNAGVAEEMLRRETANADELRAILADIRQSDLRASEIIRRVRALVTTRETERGLVDVNSIATEVLAFLGVEARRRGVTMEAALGDGLPALWGDRVQLQQAVVNLCVNAMDAMADIAPERRRLGIRTAAASDGGIEIAVSDTGSGVSPQQLPHLFDAFFTTKAHGMGLGLSIARSIVDAHGGKLSARNRDEGGALFCITLRAHGSSPQPTTPS